MASPVSFTLDLEDHRPDASAELRFPEVMGRVLDWLDEQNVSGTVFVVGEVAADQPDLVAEVAARGHEVGLHAWRHVPLTEVGPDRFGEETRRGKQVVEDITGRAVVGFRAPTFSLVPASAWAPDVLAELGFTYSSSVLAAANPLFGWPGAPDRPFRWPGGLVELPAPLAGFGPWRVPYLGGTYLRLLPWPAVAGARRLTPGGEVPWTYTHPYDFDPGEPYWPVPDAGRMARLLWVGRRRMFAKVGRVLARGAGPPLGERVETMTDLPVFGPGAAVAVAPSTLDR